MSLPQANSSVTSEIPARLTEWIVSSPRRTPTASSMGRVTRFSTSCGAVSGNSVWTTRDG